MIKEKQNHKLQRMPHLPRIIKKEKKNLKSGSLN